MGLSESTLHWLVDGEQAVEPVANDPGTAPHYDPRAPVAGRKRTVVVIGGAAIVAFVVAVVLHGQAARNRADANTPAGRERRARGCADPARGGARSRRDERARRSTSRTWRSAPMPDSPTRTSSSERSSATPDGSRSRATRTASISSWPRSARTRQRRAPRWPPCRRDPPNDPTGFAPTGFAPTGFTPTGFAATGLAARAAGALRRRRSPAARERRGGAARPIRGRARAPSSRRSPGGDGTTAPRGNGCGPCCASRPPCGATASPGSPGSTRPA